MGFNITPGMMCWNEMPEKYKKEYYICEKKRKKLEEKNEIKLQENFKNKRNNIKKPKKQKIKEIILKNQNANKVIKSNKIKTLKTKFKEDNVSNKIDNEFFEEMNLNCNRLENKPKILLISDVKGWAWWNKSQYLKKYLSDEFYIDIINVLGKNKSVINHNKYDIYLTYGYSYIDLLKRIPKKKRITGVTAHRPMNKIIGYMKKAKWLHANSMLLYNELSNYSNLKNIFYVPNGVDEKLFRPVKKKNNNTLIVGHVGKKTDQKGQDEFIIPIIEQSDVKSIYNLNNYMKRIPYIEMYKYYQDMDVFLVASKEDGTPNPALEAMSCGVPVISNKIGNMPEIIKNGHNGFLVEKDINSYVEKIKWLKNNKQKCKQMGINARKEIKKGWTWKIQAENYRELFRKIIQSNSI